MITFKSEGKTLRLEDFDMRSLRKHSRPLSGNLSHKSQHIPGQMGDWYFGTEIGAKEYELQANILQADFNELEKRLDQLTAFIFDGKGQPKLIEAHWDNSKKFAYVRLKEAIVPDVSTILEKIPISFINFDSNEYALSTAYDLKKPLEYDKGNQYGSLGYRNTQSFTWNIVPNHYSGVENYSTLDTAIKITIKGTIKGASITHLPTNQTLKLPNITNGVIVVDTETFNLSVSGVDVLEFEGDFFDLVEGSNGLLFKAEQANATVSYDWLHKYM